ncbi:MAG TPA: ribosome small subunit-dependent GTPase A [Telluria sp.]|nr:ribosome small subunit-dependent GTPase A [Telluria sp.]
MIDIDFGALRRVGLTPHIAAQLADAEPPLQTARVTEVQRSRLTLHSGMHTAPVPGIAVGDWVLVRETGGTCMVERILEPLTRLTRRTGTQRQVLATNVDTALLVMGLDLDFNLRRLERYLAVAQACHVAPVVVLTKADLGADAQEKAQRVPARLPAAVPILVVNATDARTREILAPWTGATQTLVLLGASGAGKSTLTNVLSGSQQCTGAIRADDGRGRHTTTARSLHLCPDGACIIDTPGLRAWQPDADEDAITAAFTDIDELASHCRFPDCRHDTEPGCAVRGLIDPDRLLNYRKLLREARRSVQTPLERQQELAKWKVLMRAAAARNRDKRR